MFAKIGYVLRPVVSLLMKCFMRVKGAELIRGVKGLSVSSIFWMCSLGATGAVRADVDVQAWYRLGEDGLLVDSSGNNHDFRTVIGSSAVESTQLPSTSNPSGNSYLGSSFYYTGGENGGMFDAGFQLPDDNYGVEFYVKPSDLKASGMLICNGAPTEKRGVEISFDPKRGGLQASLCGIRYVGDPYMPKDGEWVHVALVRDSGISTFYINGVHSGDTTAEDHGQPSEKDVIHLGVAPGDSNKFAGSMDELRVFTFNSGNFRVKDLLFFQKSK